MCLCPKQQQSQGLNVIGKTWSRPKTLERGDWRRHGKRNDERKGWKGKQLLSVRVTLEWYKSSPFFKRIQSGWISWTSWANESHLIFFLYSNVLHRPLPYSIQVETGVMLVIVNSKQWLNGQPKQNRPTDKQEASAHPLLLRIFFCLSYSIPFLKRSTCLLKGQEGTLQNIVAISRPHPNFTQWIILFSLETV